MTVATALTSAQIAIVERDIMARADRINFPGDNSRTTMLLARLCRLKDGLLTGETKAEVEDWARAWLEDIEQDRQHSGASKQQHARAVQQTEDANAAANEAERLSLLRGIVPANVGNPKYISWLGTLTEATRQELFGDPERWQSRSNVAFMTASRL